MSLFTPILRYFCCLVLLVIINSIEDSNICYASKALISDPSYYSYPKDIYFPNVETISKQTECFSVEKSDSKSKHSCLIEDNTLLCPVVRSHTDIALENQAEWIKQSVLCNFKSAIENKNDNTEKNVIVLGGSVTAGVSTQGCCTRDECIKDEFYCVNNYCNWIPYIGRWIETLGSNIHTYNLAHAGYNSDTFKDKIVEKLDTIRKNYQFTKSDIVFLDISVNDANTFEGTTTKMITLERGIEALIRRIHWLSKPNSIPTIILLEMWPGSTISSSGSNVYPINTPYTKAYEKVARHYNLSLWSYRDVVIDMHNNNRNPLLGDYLRYKNNFKDSAGHPPWHVHLYYADLISSIIKSQLEQCTTTSTGGVVTGNVYPVIQSVAQLPKPLIEHVFHHCDPAHAPLISITAPHVLSLRNTYNTSTSTSTATTSNSASTAEMPLGTSPADLYLEPNSPVYSSSQLNAWVLAEDKVGRPGFLHEFTTMSDKNPSVLTFQLNITHAELLSRSENPLLQILYLRTYQNAGIVNVLLCGNPVKDGRYEPVELDALWGDYETFHFSLPEVFSIDLDIGRYCNSNENKDTGKYVTIQIIHNTHMSHYSAQQKLARGNEKFKLVEIKVCKIAK